MTTSGTYSFSITRDDIIRQSLLNLGKLGEGESPSPSEVVDCSMRLNMLCKQWMGKADGTSGLKMFNRKTGYLFLSGTTGSYTAGFTTGKWTNQINTITKCTSGISGATTITLDSVVGILPLDNIGIQLPTTNSSPSTLFWTTVVGAPVGNVVTLASALPLNIDVGAAIFVYSTNAQLPVTVETASLRDDKGEDVPLDLMSLEQYMILPSKTDVKNITDPTGIYVERQLTSANIFTDTARAIDVTKYIVIGYMEPSQDFNNPLDNPTFPQEWYLALVWGLSREVAPMYNVVWTQSMQQNYLIATSIAGDLDPNKSQLYFQCGDDH